MRAEPPPGGDRVKGLVLDSAGMARRRVLMRSSKERLTLALARLEEAYDTCARACEENRDAYRAEEQLTNRLRHEGAQLQRTVERMKREAEDRSAAYDAAVEEMNALNRDNGEVAQELVEAMDRAARTENALLHVLRHGV